MMRFTIDKVLLEQVLNYLANKPYSEVVQLIASIQQDVKLADEQPPQDVNT